MRRKSGAEKTIGTRQARDAVSVTPHASRLTPRGFTVIAHRGARGHAPENTLKAFELAIKLGAPWLELDVQLHRDLLWVFHDDRLERVTNGKGRLLEQTPDYLRSLDAGQGERIPLLRDVIERVRRRAKINIELKTGNGTAAAVAGVLREQLERGWAPEDFMVSSFHLPELHEFKRRLPQVPLGVLLCGVPLDLAACASHLGAVALNIALDFADTGLVADAHRRGLKVYVYTVNEPDDLNRMKRLGVDGIFTDFPERALQRPAKKRARPHT